MATLSAVTTPNVNIGSARDQAPARDNTSLREKLASAQASTQSTSSTDTTQKNYRQQQDFANSGQADPSTLQTGNRRGNLLDLTV